MIVKTMSKGWTNRFPAVLTALMVVVALAAPAAKAGLVVNVDIDNETSWTWAYTGQGAYVTADVHAWNSFNISRGTSFGSGDSFTMSSLIASDGTTNSGLSLRMWITSGTYASYDDGAVGNDLNRDFLYTLAGLPGSFTVSGLTPGSAYDLYLYTADLVTRATTFAVGTIGGGGFTASSSASATGGSASTSWTAGVDYVRLTMVSDGAGVIEGQYQPVAGYGYFAGIQIVEAPEPASASLLGLGALLMWRRQR